MPVPLVGGAVKIFVFLELAKTISLMVGHYLQVDAIF
jgi:hypothetical protein